MRACLEAYVDELGRAVSGPRRARADLLAEVRDALIDATEAYERAGLDPDVAQRRAVEDFGPVAELAPDYQRELAASQGRRTAILICLILAPQHLVWAANARAATRDPGWMPGAGYSALSTVVEVLGAASVAGALAILVWGRLPARVTGWFAGTVAVTFSVIGLGLTLLGPVAPLSLEGVPWSVAFLIAPMAWLAWWGRRCVAFSRWRAADAGPG